MKVTSPLLGFNNNVRHKGRIFHIQTEDSGVKHPHIITHLFADGGRILKTTKTSYAEHLDRPALTETVRAMMQEQHKAMFIALRDGQFDHLFDDAAGPVSVRGQKPAPKPAPAPAAAPAPALPPIEPVHPPESVAPTAPMEPVRTELASAPTVALRVPEAREEPPPQRINTAPVPVEPAPEPPPAVPPRSMRRPSPRPRLEIDPKILHERGGDASAASAPTPTEAAGPAKKFRIDSEPSIDLDLEALERAAAEAQSSLFQPVHDLPPPPAAVLGRRASGGYSVGREGDPAPRGRAPSEGAADVGRDAASASRASVKAPASPPREADPGPAPAARQRPALPQTPAARPSLDVGAGSSGRYAPSRPASIFATSRPAEGASIFGEDLISEKSLDEVILSYLAEDLESDKK